MYVMVCALKVILHVAENDSKYCDIAPLKRGTSKKKKTTTKTV